MMYEIKIRVFVSDPSQIAGAWKAANADAIYEDGIAVDVEREYRESDDPIADDLSASMDWNALVPEGVEYLSSVLTSCDLTENDLNSLDPHDPGTLASLEFRADIRRRTETARDC